jgi:hypothetical protein
MSLLVFVAGNLAAGKSAALDYVTKSLKPEVAIFSIDAYRHKFQAHTPENEERAWDALISDVLKCKFPILETSGTSKHLEGLKKQWTGLHVTIKIDTPEFICMRRFEKRKQGHYKSPPLPFYKEASMAISHIGSLLLFSAADIDIDGSMPEMAVGNALNTALSKLELVI